MPILSVSLFVKVYLQKNFTNVIGILKGEHFGKVTDRIIGVAAHYDTVSTTAGQYTYYCMKLFESQQMP